MWLETEQLSYWRGQQRNQAAAVVQARQALWNKTMVKDLSGRTPAAVEEKEALKAATRRLEEAERKVGAVKKWMPVLKHEIMACQGGVQRLATAVQSDLPLAIGQLEGMIASLEAYVELKAPGAKEAAVSELPAEEAGQTPGSLPEGPAGGQAGPGRHAGGSGE